MVHLGRRRSWFRASTKTAGQRLATRLFSLNGETVPLEPSAYGNTAAVPTTAPAWNNAARQVNPSGSIM